MQTISVTELRKSYGSLKAVDGISFNVEAGEIFGMLGPNGAGKSTTIEILIGLRTRDSGEIRIMGLDPGRDGNKVKNLIGAQLQTPSLYPRLTVSEIIKLFSSFYPKSLDRSQVIEWVGLQEKTNVQARELSGGQLQRLAIATAMVSDGDIVFLDEPTTGLDPQARRNLWDVILNLKRLGKTVFLTTHYMDEAERLCDRVAVIDHGKIIAMGSPKELIDEHFQEKALEFDNPVLAKDPNLESLPGISRKQVEDDHVVLYACEVSAAMSALMEYASTVGTSVDDITVRRASLEDLFLKLTGRRMRE